MKTSKHRTPTPEQKQAAAERRERFKGIAKAVSDMSEDDRLKLASMIGVTTIEGRTLSVFNVCLIYSQFSTATIVGGFGQWLAAGRCVRKGEHGQMIWVPTKGKKTETTETAEETGDADTEKRPAGFIIGTVFDISQTEPKAN